MRRMKLLIFFVCLICTLPSFSQDDYDRSLNELEKVNDLLLDASASFLKFPNNHSNLSLIHILQEWKHSGKSAWNTAETDTSGTLRRFTEDART